MPIAHNTYLQDIGSTITQLVWKAAAIGAVFACLSTGVAHGDIVIDDDFSGGETYQGFAAEITGNPDSTSTVAFTVVNSGGNPGHYFEATNHHDVARGTNGLPPGGNGFTSVAGILTNVSSTFQPTSDGALGQFELAIDVRVDAGSSARNLSFYAESDRTGEFFEFDDQVTADGSWQSVSLTISPTVAGKSGEDVFFGFGFTSDADVTFNSESVSVDFDNFRVRSIAVPEPGMLPFVGSVVFGLTFFRRRSN